MNESIYTDIWSSLNQVDLSPIDDGLIGNTEGITLTEINQYFINNEDYKIIFLASITQNEKLFLEDTGLSIKYLNDNLKKTISKNGKKSIDRRKYQIQAVKERSISAICPFSGEIVTSNQSIPVTREVIFYRFATKEVFYIATTQLGQGFIKGVIYFPSHELVIKNDDIVWGLQKEHLTKLKSLIVSKHEDFYRYFSSNPQNKKVAVMLGDWSFAHQLWNELSGLYKLYEKGLLEQIDKFYVFRETLGPINEIFPQIPTEKIEHIWGDGDPGKFSLAFIQNEIIQETIIEKDYFFINVGDRFIKNRLAEKIYQVAMNNTSPEFIDFVKDAKNKHFPLLFVTLRMQDRTWTNQVDGLSKIITSLAQDYPNLGIIFDGYSLATDYYANCHLHNNPNPHLTQKRSQLDAIRAEKEIVNQIINNLSDLGIGFFSTIGYSLYEANIWAHASDLYLAHHGTIQHKIGWLANKPGIVHCNRKIAEQKPLWVAAVREFGIMPKYVDPSHIKDVTIQSNEGERRTDLDNYDIDWEILYKELKKLAQSIERKKKFPGFIVSGIEKTFKRAYSLSREIMKRSFLELAGRF